MVIEFVSEMELYKKELSKKAIWIQKNLDGFTQVVLPQNEIVQDVTHIENERLV